METPLTLNNARVHELQSLSRSKSNLGCYIVKAATSILSNDVPYER